MASLSRFLATEGHGRNTEKHNAGKPSPRIFSVFLPCPSVANSVLDRQSFPCVKMASLSRLGQRQVRQFLSIILDYFNIHRLSPVELPADENHFRSAK
jgi:hypothetical protein